MVLKGKTIGDGLRMFATMVFLMCYRNAGMQVGAIIHVSDENRL